MARKAPGKSGGRAGARAPALPESLRWIRNVGLVVVWAVAVFCGWQAGGTRADLLNAVLRGAAAWLGLMVIWLAGIGLCHRIIQASGDQAFRHSGRPTEQPSD